MNSEERKLVVQSKVQDIKDHPERHRHDFSGLTSCCMVDGALDSRVQEAHSRYASFGANGGQRCDVSSGPCACGAWH